MILDGLCLDKYIGCTVTVFVAGGGLSGSGFTGVLAGYDNNSLRLITDIGVAPNCPVYSGCGGVATPYNYCGKNPLGSVCEIPLCRIVAFTHNAV